MDYVYPAVFTKNDDGSFTVVFPDLGCVTEGKNLADAMYMAQKLLTLWMNTLLDEEDRVPRASDIKDITLEEKEFASLVCTTVKDSRAVRHTISLPKWMSEQATEAGISLSKVLQDALSKRL